MKRSLYFIILISNFTYSQVGKPQHDPPETINRYAAVLAFDICSNSITVSDAVEFNPGDTVLMIQMKGAIIDTSNTPAFGTILDYGNAGNYEFNFISTKSGNQLTFKNKITRTYDIPDGVVQLVRVPKYKAGYFSGGLVPLAWDGSTGGIICVYATLSVTSVEEIYATGRGFRGATGYNSNYTSANCSQNNNYYASSSPYAAIRGESIGSVPQTKVKGKAAVAGGGGGGSSHNSGGGGGGNGGIGGMGGFQSDSCTNAPFDNRGTGGKSLQYSSVVNKIFMGSGGGAGHMDNANPYAPAGGAGGGIIIIITDQLETFGEKIHANGQDGESCVSANCNDGNSGGGAGGTILLSASTVLSSFTVETNGGKGADRYGPILSDGRTGPGGGGGGGVLLNSGPVLPANITFIANGGANGVILQDANNPWGATAGSPGINISDWVIPYDTVLFKPNIDSVRIKDSIKYCNNIQFTGLGFTNTYPVAASGWQWYFGDGGSSTMQNPVHNYNAVGNYNVKLIVTDNNGCKDSTIKMINTAGSMFAEAGVDTAYCASGQKTTTLNGSGTGAYSWTPAAVLNNNTLQNPTATINTTTKFYLTVSNGAGCAAIDSVTITINKAPIVKAAKSNDLNCNKPFTQLNATGATAYTWLPAYALSNDSIANPIANPAITTTYYVYGKDTGICAGTDSIRVIADFKNHGIILPNSFTPDNNGTNDCFGIKYYRDVKDFDFTIFNRYGTAVFKTSNPNECWDGKYKGKPASPGSYVYIIKAKTLCGDVFIQDNLMLIR
jgi:gliding motility-associated-like protein